MLSPLILAGVLLTQDPAATQAPSAPAVTTPAAPILSELHAAQVDAHLSKLRALQAEIALQQRLLQEQRQKMDAVITLAYPGFTMDWDGGTLVPVVAPKKETP